MDENQKKTDPTAGAQPPADKPTTPLPPPPPRRRRKRLPLVIAAVILIVVIATVFVYKHFFAPYESTDDAFIEGNVTFISPRVSGPVVKLLIDDNQAVKAGDELLEIDPQDYQTKLTQAQADLATAKSQLAQAKAQIIVDEAKTEQQKAAVTAAEADAQRAADDAKRYAAVGNRAVSKSQLDLATTTATSSAANVEVARAQEKAAEAQVELSRVNADTAAANVQQAEALLRQAELDLSYTKVVAPRDGRVTRRTVETGAYISTGQALLALVPEHVWVVANFKETQLTDMRPGQPVSLEVDAYPGCKFKGKVDSLQAGSGARFSLLPPENAVGNYVKVVQRVPVKIVFDEPLDPQLDIAPGMSVAPKVKVR